MTPSPVTSGRITTALAALLLVGSVLGPDQARAAGFEVHENTTRAVARGGTGVASRRDAAAVYFNPALLAATDGFGLVADVNLIDLDLRFQRDDLVYEQSGETRTRAFEPTSNEAGLFAVPFLAASFDFGSDDFAVGLAAFGPHAYGRRCFGVMVDGECRVDEEDAARMMLVESNLLQVYLAAAVGYGIDVGGGRLALGLAAMAVYQRNDFAVVIDQLAPPVGRPWDERPERQGIFRAEDLSSWRPSANLGAAYAHSGVTVAASYRPPIHWEIEGRASIDYPESLDTLGVALTDDGVTMRTWQAGSLRTGVAYAHGSQPGRPERPLFDVELNLVWEDWSRVEHFEIEPAGDVLIAGSIEQDLATMFQIKDYQDTLALRLGGSYAPLSWLALHAGGFLESAAQEPAVTSVDFVSWERYAAGAGATLRLTAWLDLELAYSLVLSPDREVEQGRVYNQLPLSTCVGPDYDAPSCPSPGTPAGNPQNEGVWSSRFQVVSAGLSLTL